MLEQRSSGPRFIPVILAGGSGTRFWPRSRKARAKQVLALDGEQTMIQQTVERLLPLCAAQDIWVLTNDLLAETIAEQLPQLAADHILSEPAARNTAPACALAAFLMARIDPAAVLGVFPSDHVVRNPHRFAEVLRAGIQVAAQPGSIVVLGVTPTHAETGYGYIELGETLPTEQAGPPSAEAALPVRRVRRFTEKPDKALAQQFLEAGNYAWNAGIFLWSVQTLVAAIREHCPEMVPLLEQIAAAWGTPEFERVFAELYPRCENISIDFAVLEPRSRQGESNSRLFCLPGDFGWNDLGSWSALHDYQLNLPSCVDPQTANIVQAHTDVVIDAKGNYVFAPGMAVALVGVENLVVVQTEDALLITTRDRCQDVGKVVKHLAEQGRSELI
ncbi:MAG: mannose-1-phosphate guanylyltransferase [Acidobacteriota bacterium]|nr:mannose-1-phosphate guanylyltransferase [Acidobacteriota bacterium]